VLKLANLLMMLRNNEHHILVHLKIILI